MRTHFKIFQHYSISLLLSLTFWLGNSGTNFLPAQALPDGLNITLAAHQNGRTTGHGMGDPVFDLVCTNTGNNLIRTTVGPYIIRTRPKYQIVYLPPEDIIVRPHSTFRQPVQVICLEAGKPMPPPNTKMGTSDQWSALLPYQPALTSSDLADQPGIKQISYPPGTTGLPTYPGSTKIFPFTIDPGINPGLFDRFVFELQESIRAAVTDIPVNTVLSDRPEVEEFVLNQVLTWEVLGSVTGKPYTPGDLEEQLVFLFTEDKKAIVPPGIREDIHTGAAGLWDAVSFIGIEAKVLTTLPGSGQHQLNVACCTCIDLPLRLNLRLQRDSFKKGYSTDTTINFLEKKNHITISVSKAFGVTLQKGDIFSIAFDPLANPWLNCKCLEKPGLDTIVCQTVTSYDMAQEYNKDVSKKEQKRFRFSGYRPNPSFNDRYGGYPGIKDFELPDQTIADTGRVVILINLKKLVEFSRRWDADLEKAISLEERSRLLRQREQEEKQMMEEIAREAEKLAKKDLQERIQTMRKEYGNGSKTDSGGVQYLFIIRDPDKYQFTFKSKAFCSDLGERCTGTTCNYSIILTP
ncbi:MAG: hypothetical protein EP344_15040 [Bacteroidetes bacterium]|nr:MAG: hypothetical protein EP344_15040 [Bacteroidota bacterium]